MYLSIYLSIYKTSLETSVTPSFEPMFFKISKVPSLTIFGLPVTLHEIMCLVKTVVTFVLSCT